MKPAEFNYDNYNKKCELINKRVSEFKNGKFLPVVTWTHNDSVYADKCRYREESLSLQLDGVTRTLETDNDWVPYIEPWHGVGVYAQAFGCPFEWSETDAPWTRVIVNDIQQLRDLAKPDINKSEMLQYVLETTEYFNKVTKGEVAIGPTDTQGPLSTLSLICDPCWMLTEAWDYPEDFHRVLNDIADLIIEFSLEQKKLCAKRAAPGHSMWSPAIFSGISLSDDMLAMIGPDYYEEFGKPYDQKIANALGGAVIHSCGKWAHTFEIVKSMKNITMVDLAISNVYDPDPNIPEKIIEGFENSGIPVQVRCDPKDTEQIDRILVSDVRTVLCFWWDDDPAKRQQYYELFKRKWESFRNGKYQK